MQDIRLLFAAFAIIVAFAVPAQAQNNRSWVSGTGLDTNTCLRNAPCLTLNGAYGKTNIGGEINCVDAGTYSSLTIGHSITIDCAEGLGFTNGLIINIPVGTMNDPRRTVILRGLNIGGFASEPGVQILAAATVIIERASVSHFQQQGIVDQRAGFGMLSISDSTITANVGVGILVVPAAGSVITVSLANVKASNNSYGLAVGAGGRVMIARSVFTANANAGIEVDSGSVVGVSGSLVSFNSLGLQNFGTMTVAESDINSNSTAVSGTVQSYGNNRVFANSADGTPLTSVGSLSSENGQR